ncbi:B/F/G family RNA polymerase sigma-70 factor [Prauserella sp. PE36]|uniref:SigB/SigF/SigG family RNA polymerase sigma factor n=1 Tax=Prauserella endophytica TaxID=1592324 RepID=A0ABY2RZS6_9PSEU|nr:MULTISPECIES: SigB/SigF/SigG family RNA polymerase sigma factor [Prauserella]PXY24913.1 RNA polymerase subunit sigma [Prauserella coralliicola]RBM16940.1 B/F/G family RNA polymerase sigma-70 factor [Prauserella sp. PE36]TKG66671.1 SigB/SigF/SigG family RNA polymerase sigma factor [Prauserella endophytica]
MTSEQQPQPEVPEQGRGYEDVAPLLTELAALPREDPRHTALREEVITRCLPLAEHIARRFSGRGESRDDLLQVARLGLLNAIDRFDTSRGTEFVAFAVPTIMGEVRRHFRDASWAVRVPRRLKELHLALSQTSGRLAQRLGRAPTPSELAAELDLDPEDVWEGLLAGNAYQSVSMDAAHNEDGTLPLAETVGEDDAELEHVEYHESLQPLLAQLPERERRVLILRFYGNMTQTQIAERVGISQMHVSRLLARTLAFLRARLTE